MKFRGQRQRGRFATGQSGARILVVLACFVLLGAAAALLGRTFSQSTAPPTAPAAASVPAERYAGIVQLAPDRNNRCQQFRLDNRSGTLTPIGSGPCADTVATIRRKDAPVAPAGGGDDNRFKGVGDYFRAR